MKSFGLMRLGRDAEVRFLPDGTTVANLSLAVTYGQKQQDGNYPTQWIDASLWGKAAESLAPYLKKGTVHGFHLSDLHIETYESRTGPGHKLAARVDSVELGPRQGDAAQGQGQQQSAPARQQAAPTQQRQQMQPRPAPDFRDMDDDIPF
jgi:single-strand DNA-binding protein